MIMKNHINKLKGFTLIELIVVITVMSILSIVTGRILISVVRAQQKAQMINGILEAGGKVTSTFEEQVRTGKNFELVDIDGDGVNELTFEDQFDNNKVFGYSKPLSPCGAPSHKNGFVYFINQGDSITDESKLTSDDISRGINVETFLLDQDAAFKGRVILSISINRAICNNYESGTDFRADFETVATSRSVVID